VRRPIDFVRDFCALTAFMVGIAGPITAAAQVPKGMTTTPLPSALIKEIRALLPDGKPLPSSRPEFLAKEIWPNMKLTQGGQISFTFIDEGAGYRNAVGYFTFDDAGKVLETKVIFENASEYGGGGDLLPGDTVDLGRFPAGTNLGFYVIADGYSRKQSLPSQSPANRNFYSLDSLNPIKDRHVAMISTRTKLADGSAPLLLGFEDLPLTTGDKDYNDVVFLVKVSADALPAVLEAGKIPVSPIVVDRDGDGVDDAKDQFPDDPLRAFSVLLPGDKNYYFMAVEDLFPYVGDGDYNDLVTAFRINQVTNAKGRIVDLKFVHHAVARGAAYDHELHHRVRWQGTTPAESVVRRFGADGKPLEEKRTRHLSGGADLTVFASTHQVLVDPGSSSGLANTEKGRPQVRGGYAETTLTFDTALDATLLEAAPFDPYLLVVDTGFDIHLVGKTALPTTRNPSSVVGRSFLDDRGYPFCMLVPASWSYPEEKVSIELAYPRFGSFRQSMGAKDLDWYRSPAATGVRTYSFAE
jgi:LruC domain-containing protein